MVTIPIPVYTVQPRGPSFTYLVSWTVRARLWERVHNCLFYKLNTTKILPQRPVLSRRLCLSAVTIYKGLGVTLPGLWVMYVTWG
jgi:hypothetical protein